MKIDFEEIEIYHSGTNKKVMFKISQIRNENL